MRSQINFLRLAYPPISNQEADWLWGDVAVREYVSNSQLYMIGQRREVFFDNFRHDDERGELIFDLQSADTVIEGVRLPLSHYDEDLELELGPKIIKIWRDVECPTEDDLLDWLTVDSLLYDHWRGRREVYGLEAFRVFTSFDLYYVGISKVDDSFSRLFANGHENRARMLSNGTQFEPTARLTDELYIFMFELETLGFARLEPDASEEDIERFLTSRPITDVRLVADAEKAFVKVMNTGYNRVKYKQYPVSADGLYRSGLDRWAFTIDEALVFRTGDIELEFELCLQPPNPVMGDTIHTDGEAVIVVSRDGVVREID
jgi:hypothetical protein